MGLSARRPQLPMLRMPQRQNDPYNSIIAEQDDGESSAGMSAGFGNAKESGSGSGNGMHGCGGGLSAGLEISPSTPVTPLPGTPIPYDKCSQSGSTPVTPGFANAINPFTFAFTSASTTTSSSSTPTGSHTGLLMPGLKRTKSGSSESSMSSASSGMHTPGAISPLGMLGSGFNFGMSGGMKRSRGFGMGEMQKEKEGEEAVWEEREVGILESFLLNPLRPLSTPYPPGTLPPSDALDELTSQILHFHRPTAGSSSKKPTLSMSSSQSAPSLKDDATFSKPVRPTKHRRTTSASGIPWKHSWSATRRKLYEIARKEARGDSREDRFKGRADIKSKAFLTAAGVEVGPFSPMIMEGQDVPGGVVMDDGQKMQIQRTGSEIRLELPSEMKESFFPFPVKEPRTTIGPVLRASTSLQRSSRFNPAKPPAPLPVAAPFQARPSLLQRGKSFTAEDFNAALTLSSSPASSDRMQVETEPLFPNEENLNDADITENFHSSVHKPNGHYHNESFDSVTTTDSDMNAPATPETTPGITLTSPSPSRNRAQQMKEMGSPTPGSNTDLDGSSFGEVLTIAPPKSKFTRPSPMARSRSSTECHRGFSAVSQFMLGNGFSSGTTPHGRSYTEESRPEQVGVVPPQAKRMKLTLDMGAGSGDVNGLLGPALASPFDENKKF